MASDGTPNPPAATSPKHDQTERRLSWRKWSRSSDQGAEIRPQGPTDADAVGKEVSEDSDEEFWSSDKTKKPNARPALTRSETGTNFPEKSHSNPFSSYSINTAHLKSRGKVSNKDGRLHISVNDTAGRGYLAKTLSAGIKHHLRSVEGEGKETKSANLNKKLKVKPIPEESLPIPKLNIVIMVIGSRGDIQPFIKIGKTLKEEHGHRVRIASHPAFKDFVEKDCGLEFFSVGGNPSELMAFMVKNPGLIPSVGTIMKGEIGRRRDQMAEMFEGFWRSCVNASDDPTADQDGNDKAPFVADAIIANPPSFAHIHCAERLGCPLHIVFTFPYTPTQAFPHPLANIKQSNVDSSYANFMSYPLVEMMTWQGLGDLVNDFREKTLGLDPVSTVWAPGQLYRLKVPYTYLWSPGLCPKPADWGAEVDIAGFVFLDLASNFQPPKDLSDFLEAGDKPIYIGFGSIVIDDPDGFTKMIFDAVDKAGVRAIINKGWGGIGGGSVPDNVFMIDNVPHDWLFPRCKAVVHHGGAGTTAIGLKCAKPTMIVPFFGDQPFWGHRVADAKAGAFECIPYKELTLEKFVEGIKQCLSEEAQMNVQKIADSIAKEGDGARNAVESFLAHLPFSGNRNMRCSVIQDRAAVWQIKGTKIRLSALAAELLISQKKIAKRDLRLYRQFDWNDFQGAGGPITGGGGAIVKMIAGFGKGISAGPFHTGKDIQKRASHQLRKTAHQRRQKERLENEQRLAAEEKEKSTSSASPESSSAADVQDAVEEVEKPESQQDEKPAKRKPSAPMQRHETDTSVISADPEGNVYADVAKDMSQSIWRPIGAVARFPMDLFTGIANGFHNAPRLYGDTTVRRPIRITGVKSGMHAASNEFVLGTWDAFSGLVTQPYNGAKQYGPLGFASGIGKGIGGLILKECAAVIGPFGYSMKGVYREAVKSKTPVKAIRHRRHKQGQRQILEMDDASRQKAEQAASRGWKVLGQLLADTEKIKAGKLVPGDDREREDASWIAGLTGRFNYAREKEEWEKYGAFDNAERLQKFADGRRQGLSLQEIADQIVEEKSPQTQPVAGHAVDEDTLQQIVDNRTDEAGEDEKDEAGHRQPEMLASQLAPGAGGSTLATMASNQAVQPVH